MVTPPQVSCADRGQPPFPFCRCRSHHGGDPPSAVLFAPESPRQKPEFAPAVGSSNRSPCLSGHRPRGWLGEVDPADRSPARARVGRTDLTCISGSLCSKTGRPSPGRIRAFRTTSAPGMTKPGGLADSLCCYGGVAQIRGSPRDWGTDSTIRRQETSQSNDAKQCWVRNSPSGLQSPSDPGGSALPGCFHPPQVLLEEVLEVHVCAASQGRATLS